MSVWLAGMSVHHVCAASVQVRREYRVPRTGVTVSHHVGAGKLSLGPLKEKSTLFPTEPSLQALSRFGRV